MKRCPKCDTDKPKSEFSKDARRKDGLQCYCKACNADYKRSPVGKASHRRNSIKMRVKYPEKMKARSAVRHAVRADRIPRPSTLTCTCGKPAEEYHHFAGYDDPEDWFNIDPYCRPCHP